MNHPSQLVMDTPEDGIYVKGKKTRRRLRVSCVECTKRRQKCDRNYPCSLCIQRGVQHLCRWESVPLARPTPARPPAIALKDADILQNQDRLISDLRQRISRLEKDLQEREKGIGTSISGLVASDDNHTLDGEGHDMPSSLLPDVPETSQQQAPSDTLIYPRALRESSVLLLDDDYLTSAKHVQLSMAHHGEFIGRGSLLCALHSVTEGPAPRLLYAKSTDATSGYRESTRNFSRMPFVGRHEELLSYIPPTMVVEVLTSAFFDQINWRYGIPEKWFRGARLQMWTHSREAPQDGVGVSHLNANWLMLLFAVLALAPQSSYEEVQHHSVPSNDDYFMCAMMARRLVEEEYLDVPNTSVMVSAADGTVLGCLATALLCDYLAQRGRVSEAWKLIGHAIRNAIAVGMHYDPECKLWQTMSRDEVLLRRRTWWALFTSDKTYSYILGRPQVLRRGIFQIERSSEYNLDGSLNHFNVGQYLLLSLMDLLEETMEKCFGIMYPDCPVFLEMDERFQQWEDRLPDEYRMDRDILISRNLNSIDVEFLSRQRYIVHSWYLIGRLRLNVASVTGQCCRPPQTPGYLQECMSKSILVALQVIRYQTMVYNSPPTPDSGDNPTYPGDCWLFVGCFSLFEASVALCTTLLQYQWEEKLTEAKFAIDAALVVFNAVTRRESREPAETATRAIEVLIMLRDQQWPSGGTSLTRMKDESESPELRFTPLPKIVSEASPPPFSSSTHFGLSSVRENDWRMLEPLSH